VPEEPLEPQGRPSAPPKPRKERRLARHARHARMLWHDPRSAGGLLREGLLGIWRARGGGFYGLGYVATFVALEVRLVVGELESSDSLLSFLSDQLLEYLLRLGFMSFVNVLLAFLWPLFVLEHLHGWGIPLLVIGYFGFERWLRPAIESSLPELRKTAPAPAAPEDDRGESDAEDTSRPEEP
jgi:hypothetical protein